MGLIKRLFGGGNPPSPPGSDDGVRSLLCSIHDSVMVLALRGWAELEIEARISGDQGVQGLKLATRGPVVGTAPAADLGIETDSELGSLGAAVAGLVRATCGNEVPPLVRLSCMQVNGGADWRLVDDSNRQRMAFRLEPKVLGQLLFGAPLLAALEANAAEIDVRQAALAHRTGEFTHYDLNTAGRRLVFHYEVGEPRTHRIEHVGTYVRGPSAWAWAWSIPQTGPEGCPAVFRACSPKERQPGMSALWLPQFTCGEGFAYKIGLLVAQRAGAAGIFAAEYDDHSRFVLLAVFEQVSA